MNVKWHPYDYENKPATAPDSDSIVWIVEGGDEVTLGYFDGFTFRLWSGSDDCDVRYWAEMEYPEASE